MSWDYSFTAKARKELKKLGHEPARKIIQFLDERVQGVIGGIGEGRGG